MMLSIVEESTLSDRFHHEWKSKLSRCDAVQAIRLWKNISLIGDDI